MNCKEFHAELLRKLMDLKRSNESDVTRNMKEENRMERDDSSLARKWSMCSETAVGKSKEFMNEKRDLRVIMQLIRVRGYIKKFNASLKAAKEAFNSCIVEDKMRIGKKRPVTERDLEEVNQVSNKLEQWEDHLNLAKKITEKLETFFVERNSRLNRRQTPSEVLKSIRDGNCMNDRRNLVRREVLNKRRSNQLKEANLHRGLDMEEDCQAASKSDLIFDLKSLDEALPSVSHCKRTPGIKRPLKLQDMAMNEMKENHLFPLAATGLCSVNNNTEGEHTDDHKML